MLIFANKQDIEGALTLEEISEILQLKAIEAGARHTQVVACSAVTGDGLLKGFDWLVGDISQRIYLHE